MRLQKIERLTNVGLSFLKRNAPYILAGAGAVGVVVTVISSIKATENVCSICFEEEDTKTRAKEFAKAYASTAAFGLATLGCIIGGAILSKKAQVSLSSAYILLDKKFNAYREKVIERHGEQEDFEIQTEVSQLEKVDVQRTNLTGSAYGITGCLDIEDDSQMHTFYDSFGDRYFEATTSQVLQAEYHTNRNMVLGLDICLNDFYEFLGIPTTEQGNGIGWRINDAMYWIDFDHEKVVHEDGSVHYIISAIQDPLPWEELDEII